MIQAANPRDFIANANDQSTKLAKAAIEFERLFVEIMFKEMRRSVGNGGLIEKNTGEQIFTEMLDSEYARKMVQNGDFGLARTIVEQLSERDKSIDSASALRALNARNNYARSNNFDAGALRSFNNTVSFSGANQTNSNSSLEKFPQNVRRWEKIIEKASIVHGVDKTLIAAVMEAESAGNPKAVSRAGASGLMQLMPGTARDMGVKNVFDPTENIMGGVRYLRLMLDRFGGDLRLALAAYNAGPGNVERFGGIPPFRETRNYVENITRRLGEENG